jgi:hypothetical protein
MADERPPPPALDDVKKEYIALLMSILKEHAGANEKAHAALREIQANPQRALDGGLLELIKVLCDCKAIIVILECLCKALT